MGGAVGGGAGAGREGAFTHGPPQSVGNWAIDLLVGAFAGRLVQPLGTGCGQGAGKREVEDRLSFHRGLHEGSPRARARFTTEGVGAEGPLTVGVALPHGGHELGCIADEPDVGVVVGGARLTDHRAIDVGALTGAAVDHTAKDVGHGVRDGRVEHRRSDGLGVVGDDRAVGPGDLQLPASRSVSHRGLRSSRTRRPCRAVTHCTDRG